MVDIQLVRFDFLMTYFCNASCKDCMRMLDVSDWKQKDFVSVEDIVIASEILAKQGITVDKTRISGGEPLLHPDFDSVYKAIQSYWKPKGLLLFSNGTIPYPKRYRRTKERGLDMKEFHTPVLISPVDLGLKPVRGITSPCKMMVRCGSGFSPYGFMACGQSGYLGRLLNVDAHSELPVLNSDPDICQHCVFSLGQKDFFAVETASKNGTLEYPTKTYREGLKRLVDKPYPKLFQDRI